MADGKNEYSTSDSLRSSITVLPRSELLVTNSATKNYEVQKCLKLKLYSIQPLIVWVENLPESTWCLLILILDRKILGDWQRKNYIWKWCVVLVFIIYKNLEVSVKILSHGLSRSYGRDWLEQGSSSYGPVCWNGLNLEDGGLIFRLSINCYGVWIVKKIGKETTPTWIAFMHGRNIWLVGK